MTKQNILEKTYYDVSNPGSFSGVENLRRNTNIPRHIVKNWLSGEDAYTLHKRVVKGKRRATIVSGIRIQYQCDLMDTQNIKKENDMYAYVLLCIDIFSKMAYARPLKNKTSTCVIPALKSIFEEAGLCKQIQTDKGSEFLNRRVQDFLRSKNIKHFTSQNENIKCAIVERLIRTIRDKLGRYFTYSNSVRYIDKLQAIMTSYNNSFHRSIQMKPIDVSPDNAVLVRETLYGHIKPITKPSSIQPGDQVRITKSRMVFKKSYLPSWSEEIFTVSRVLNTIPYTYKLKDYNGDELTGSWYAFEIQQVLSKEVFTIEKVLDERRLSGAEKEILVRWKGYSKDFDSWIPQSYIVSNKKTGVKT